MDIVYVVIIHEDSLDELDTKVYVHRTTVGLYERLCDYIQKLKNYQWDCDMPRRPTIDEVNTQLRSTTEAVTLYKIGEFANDRFTIEFTAQRHILGD